MNDYAKQGILLVVGVLIGLAILHFFGGNNNDGRADAIRTDLQRIEEKQQYTIERIGRIEKGLDKSIVITEGISSRIGEVVDSVGAVESRINASKGRIIDSQLRIETGIGILQGIREREAKRNP